MEVGACVWVRDEDSEDAWLYCEVLKREATKLLLKDREGRSLSRGIESRNEETGETKFDGVELANTPLSDDDKHEGRDNDLITLPHLHEPAILHSLSDRFFRGKIYTWTGPVLIAVNPFQRLPLYENHILEQYRRDGLLRAQGMQSDSEDLDPHIFAIADRSYRQMMSEARRSQSILISGESGAGKTESTKVVMLYLTTLGAATSSSTTTTTTTVGGGGGGALSSASSEDFDSPDDMSIMQKVLQSNPVLEAFGNARTLRNDNSSRFGKFIELGFSRAGHLMGARVQTYLLEKVRLAFHAAGERNYHIFYQLLRGAKEEDHDKYKFHDGITGGLDLPNFFHYTGQGGAPHLREFTDEDGLSYTLKAMRRLGWSEETIDLVLMLIAGLLHLGQISFNSVEKDGNETAEIAQAKILGYSANLLGVDVESLRMALTERIIVARGQEIKTQLTPERAADARDALAKTIYGALFLWVVDQVNICVGWENDSDIRSSCGVLDIFGFECFAINSFEQLCINYTNEALQQQFNQFIFKLEQAEYEAEQINWAFIEFPDNQDCLDTIQAPQIGILSMLDDECRLPKGSDKNWAKRMYDQYVPNKNQTVSENTRFQATNIQKSKNIFSVRHFAGLVQYTAETNFMEKNKDEIPLTAHTLFRTAHSKLIRDTYAIQERENSDRAGGAAAAAADAKSAKTPKQKTVGQQFKEQLSSLIENVQKTDPHYIRCIKPNDAAKPLLMVRKRTTEQLRYGGVLEAVRVARAGYPVRMYHHNFYQRYRMLLPTTPDKELPWNMEGHEPQKLCVSLVDFVLKEGEEHRELTKSGPLDPHEAGITRSEKIRRMRKNQPIPMAFPKTDVQLGKTKVFMRKHPHDCLEAHRVFHQNASAIILQSWARGLAEQRQYLITLDAVQTVQRCYRGFKGREKWTNIRKAKAGMLLTKVFRMLIKWREFNRAKKGTIRYQALARGYNLRRLLATIIVQRYYRRFIMRKHYKELRSAILALQCALRCRVARKLFFELKKEQKDVGKLKQNNEKLKQEMASLRAMLAAQAKESAAGEAHSKALKEKQDRIAELEMRIADIEKELAAAKQTVEKLEADLARQVEETSKEKHRRRPSGDGGLSTSPKSKHNRRVSADMAAALDRRAAGVPLPPLLPSDYASSEALAEHRAKVAILEEELEEERRLRRQADGEIIRLRAEMNGVKLNEAEVKALLAPQLSGARSEPISEESSLGSFADDDSPPKRKMNGAPPPEVTGSEQVKKEKVQQALNRLGYQEEKEEKPSLFSSIRAGADFIPMIRRGLAGNLEQEVEEVAVGWKVEVRTRRHREEFLRDEVHRYEARMKKFVHMLEEGVEVVMWQLNLSLADGSHSQADTTEEFAIKSSNLTLKLHRRGEHFVQNVLTFVLKSGYLSKAMGRNRNVDKSALEPLSLHDILEVRAGCSGFDHTELPGATGSKTKSKTKPKLKSNENKQTSLFMTIKATPTPLASARSYIFRFKSRSARNDVINGLRCMLADMQIKEGVSISNLHHSGTNFDDDDDADEIMVPLSAVDTALNRERESYDRILLLLLQGGEDLKEKEDELLGLRCKLEAVVDESKEKDRVQANDSKLIMQLSKKLETLLMDNEDLRDQNDRLNSRLVSIESDKMNMLPRS